MTDRKQYTDDQLEVIADALWGSDEFDEDASRHTAPCPICGADIKVYVNGLSRRPPPRFRAICSICGIDSSGQATSVEMRTLQDEEMDDILELHRRGQKAHCPACTTPLQVTDIRVLGRGVRHFAIKCLRCGTRGQKRLSPPQDSQ